MEQIHYNMSTFTNNIISFEFQKTYCNIIVYIADIYTNLEILVKTKTVKLLISIIHNFTICLKKFYCYLTLS